ncbi:MAG: 1-acyl-sn-glycerol-3-phosphate acyltransferase [Chitinophagaceae bacterium]|jgi:glycerol-3-phosphate O-acyltransferase/dihydroxyacetone phosphate acyltransferase|nr:1-acyl-sn-glycerol-3-phosphate acyltransferase [Chitinophagaceae bacterium]
MLYSIAKVIMWMTLHLYFRRIVFQQRRSIPDGEPVILIANHAASFLDAMLLGVLMNRPVHFFARSDIFRKPLANRMLRKFRMIPIYNVEHGKSDLVRNEETFAEGEAVLNNRGLLLIFPEGISRVERIMLPLKKGTARVALQTEAKRDFRLGLKVIPVGINYSRHRFRADVLISAGAPTLVSDYEAVYRENPAKAITRLTRELEEKFSRTIYFVRQPERTALIDRLLELYRSDAFNPLDALRGTPVLELEKRVCDTVSEMSDTAFERISGDLDRYDAMLAAHGFADASVNGRYRFTLLHVLALIITFPVFLLSSMLNAVPMWLARFVADRTVTRIDFYTSVHTAAGGFIYLLWWILLMIVGTVAGGAFTWVSIFAPVTLFAGIRWWEASVSLFAHLRYLWAARMHPSRATDFRVLRDRIAFWPERP